MTVTSGPLTGQTGRTWLRALARGWDNHRAWTRAILLGATVHESLDEPLKDRCQCGRCLTCMWDAYRWDLDLADGLGTKYGPEHILDDLDGPGTWEAAEEEIAMRVAGAEDILLRGWPVARKAAA